MSKTPSVIYFHLDEIFRTTFAQLLRRENTSEWEARSQNRAKTEKHGVVESIQLLHSYLEVLSIDLIILDEYFLDKCYALSCQHPTFPKLLVFTSKRSTEKHQEFKERGADDLIVMPESNDTIIKKIKNLTSS